MYRKPFREIEGRLTHPDEPAAYDTDRSYVEIIFHFFFSIVFISCASAGLFRFEVGLTRPRGGISPLRQRRQFQLESLTLQPW
jgi:hypothetical protein